jgi:hypothetical protein
MAMTLIMSIRTQKADGSILFPNIDFLQSRNKAGLIGPPQGSDKSVAREYLQDMLCLVEFDLYHAFAKNAGTDPQNPGDLPGQTLGELTDRLSGVGNLLIALGKELGPPANAPWDGEYPHGCHWILREAVASLLS